MIKILFFIEKFGGGGAEKVLRDLVNHMDQTQFDITVQSVWPYEEGKLLAPGVKYKSVYSARNKVTEKLYRAEAASGLLYKLHVKDNYDIECAFLEAGPTKVIASSTNKKAKKIAWVHCDLQIAVSDTKAFTDKCSPWYSSYDEIVCVSQRVKESFDTVFENRFPSTVLYNVVDDHAVQEQSIIPLPEKIKHRRFTVLLVGRLTPPKKIDRLLRAHKRLLEEGYPHDIWILGDGELRGELEQYVMENHLTDSVWMPGFVKNPYPFFREADLLACSSVFEGYSTFITEGLILGKPIVTTDVSGAREQLGNSEFGLVVENEDEAFYQGLKQMISDKALLEHYEKMAKRRSPDFSCGQRVKETELFLKQILS